MHFTTFGYEPAATSLWITGHLRDATPSKNTLKMTTPSTPPMPDHIPGHEIETKHKEAIRQLYKQAHFAPSHLSALYNIGISSINRILRYDQPERARLTQTRAYPKLNDAQVNSIIKYLSETYCN